MRSLLLCAATISAPAAATDWLQFGFDAGHSGINTAETSLSHSTVAQLKLMYSATLPGHVEGAPVLLGSVATPSGTRDVLYLTQVNGTLLAIDATTGALLWSQYPTDTPPCATRQASKPCVTASSPALDPNRQFVYNYALDGYVHKYHVGDGSELTGGGWPQLASAKPDDEQVSATLSFATAHNGTTYLYATFSSPSWQSNDSGDYQGHVTAINLAAGTQITFNVACSDRGNTHFVHNGPNPPVLATPDCLQQSFSNNGTTLPTGYGGIWGRASVVYDAASDSIYLSTGNGIFDANNGGHNWGDSVLRLPAALDHALTTPLDSYTPSNFLNLMYYDNDLGSASLALAPGPAGASRKHLGVQASKDSYLRLLDLDNMSGMGGPGNTGGEIFVGNVPQLNEVKTQPLAWTNPSTGSVMLIVANNFGISATEVFADPNNDSLPTLRHSGVPNWTNPGVAVYGSTTSTGGTSPVVANGVLYYAGGSGVVALDPGRGATLWSDASMGAANSTTRSSFHKQSLIVVNGHVYVADNNGKLWAYQRGDIIFANGFQ